MARYPDSEEREARRVAYATERYAPAASRFTDEFEAGRRVSRPPVHSGYLSEENSPPLPYKGKDREFVPRLRETYPRPYYDSPRPIPPSERDDRSTSRYPETSPPTSLARLHDYDERQEDYQWRLRQLGRRSPSYDSRPSYSGEETIRATSARGGALPRR